MKDVLLGDLEKCIDICMKLKIEDNDLSRFAFIKIQKIAAMLLLDCRADVLDYVVSIPVRAKILVARKVGADASRER